MADSTRKRPSFTAVPAARLTTEHSGDSTEKEWVIDADGSMRYYISMTPSGSLATGSFEVLEAPFRNAPSGSFQTVNSGSLCPNEQTVLRGEIYGAVIHLRVFADDKVEVVGNTN